MGTRRLSNRERLEATRVFQNTIPYDKIAITGSLGIGDRPYTTPNPWPWDWEAWDIHFGTDQHWQVQAARYGTINIYWWTLIHELTHVWQGHNSFFHIGYIFNSLWHQLLEGQRAYVYTPGRAWGDYNVEQQAHLVEDWYARGCQMGDERFPYIRDFIWRRRT